MKPFSWELQGVVESRKRSSKVTKLLLGESTDKSHKVTTSTNTYMFKHTEYRAGMEEGKYTERDD